MKISSLVLASLRYYWRTNLAVVLGVATAVSVLSGALLVGDSVRASLRDLFLSRLGKANLVVAASHYFPEDLASRLQEQPRFRESFSGLCPFILTQGIVTHQESRRRASSIQVYGVDDRFWQFHGQSPNPSSSLAQRDAWVSENLAREAGIRPGDSILLRLEAPSDVPAESLHGKKEGLGRTVRLTVRQILPPSGIGEFSLLAQQGPVNALFVPLDRLQKELEREAEVNCLLVAEPSDNAVTSVHSQSASQITDIIRRAVTLQDLGVRLKPLAGCATSIGGETLECFSLERSSTLLEKDLIDTALVIGSRAFRSFPVLTYLANHIRFGGRQIPYSLVTAIDPVFLRADDQQGSSSAKPGALPSIWLNEWAARDLQVRPGEVVSLEYYVWRDEGGLATESANFLLEAILPISGLAADRNLAPEYPGISDSDTLSDWDPPFPMDLGLIRPKDEDYWKRYRTTPKAFVSLEAGQRLWHSRFGSLSSLRFLLHDPKRHTGQSQGGAPVSLGQIFKSADSFALALRKELDPLRMGFSVLPVREQGLAASRGATDFGEYFTYFSFFLVVSALLLATLFFRLGIEQRFREIGLLKSLGFAPGQIRNLFLQEGALLAFSGSLLGLFGAWSYGHLILYGLRHWWAGAVGTTHLSLHVYFVTLFLGGFAGVLASLGCIVWTLRRLVPISPRRLLAGLGDPSMGPAAGTRGKAPASVSLGREPAEPFATSRLRRFSPLILATACALAGALLLLAALLQIAGQVGAFFGAGILFLTSLLFLQSFAFRQGFPKLVHRQGIRGISGLGLRSAAQRPGRSLLCIAMIASAAFIIVAVESFRREGENSSSGPHSGTGGFSLFAQSLLPILHDFNSQAGREFLNLSVEEGIAGQAHIFRFRVRDGEDTSCLNLFQPSNPRILAPTASFLSAGRFSFRASLAASDAERQNPWLLLDKQFSDGAIPVIGDANSLAYVLHLKIGADWALNQEGSSPLRLRVVAALDDSLFQSELLMSEANFRRVFPKQEGYRFFLIDTPSLNVPALTQLFEERLTGYGLDVLSSTDRLESFHRVENTYLSTFQALGGLGLLLGTLGLAVVLLRNVLERRRELALLRAVGYSPQHLRLMILAENILLLGCGLVTGTLCALLAIFPSFSTRGWNLPWGSLGWLLLAVLLAGLLASLLVTRIALRLSLLETLRAE